MKSSVTQVGPGVIEKRHATGSKEWSAKLIREFDLTRRVGSTVDRRSVSFRVPRVYALDRRRSAFTMEFVGGDLLCVEKWPDELPPGALDRLIQVCDEVSALRLPKRHVPSYSVTREVARLVDEEAIERDQAERFLRISRACRPVRSFAHGDLIGRNVIESPNGLVLIDWEHGGICPVGFDLAMLWLTSIHVCGARSAIIEQALARGNDFRHGFLLSAFAQSARERADRVGRLLGRAPWPLAQEQRDTDCALLLDALEGSPDWDALSAAR